MKAAAKKWGGFTLLELLVVVIIIGLLAAYVGPKYFNQLEKSKQQTTKTQLEAFSEALDAYHLDNGSYPSTEEGLMALEKNVANLKTWSGPYLKKAIPLDPWGHEYVYKKKDEESFTLYSLGRSGSDSQDNSGIIAY